MFSMKKILARWVKPLSSNKHTEKVFKVMYRFGLFGLFGDEWDFTRNGEVALVKLLKKKLTGPVVIFDVGANEGHYTDTLLSAFNDPGQSLTIHGFEPASDTFARYAARFKKAQNVIGNNVGLSDKSQVLRLYKSSVSSGFASLYEENKFDFSMTEDISLTTLDAYCSLHKVDTIDFLKMDVEGHELAVLQGAHQMLAKRKVKVIQFEFGAGNISSRTYFKDFYDLLSNNYKLFRIVKNGLVPIARYDYSMEVFGRVTNYVAIEKSLSI